MALVKHDERYGSYMTANNAPWPYAASASQSNWGAFRAFSESLDDDITFSGLAAGTEQWVQIKLDAAIRVWAFRITCRTTVSAKDSGQVPKNFRVQGSVDGTAFEDIQTYTDMDWNQFISWGTIDWRQYNWSDSKKIEITCDKEYQYYRFQFGECQAVRSQIDGSVPPTPSNTVKLTLIDLYQVEGDDAVLTGIEVTTPPTKLEYTVGDTFDASGMVVSRVYSDGSKVATDEYMISGFDSNTTGTKTVSITCDGYSATFDIVITAQATSITVVPPAKVEYLYGEKMDTTGMVVTATYADDTTAVVTGYTISGYNASTLGEQTITVSYRGASSTFKVTVINAISGIEATPPDKVKYTVGDTFDGTGMSVQAVWLDDTKTDVADYTVSGFDSSVAGTITITVTYGDFSDTFDVEIAEPVVMTGIRIASLPDKTTYHPGDEFDSAGLVVNAVYSDGSSAVVTDYTLSGFDSDTLGSKTITVTYREFTTTFTVVVQEATYTVKFVDWDGNTIKTETVKAGTAATAPSNPMREGYTFTGWDTDFSNVQADLTVTAVYAAIPIALRDILGTTTGMTAIRDNSKNDDGTDALDGVDWFTYDGVIASKIYVSGNNWIGFGTSSEHLKVCRRDGVVWYVYRQEGVLTNGHKFLKIRVEGYTHYSSPTSDERKLVYEVFLFDDNSMYLNVIQTPTDSSYIGTSALVCGSKTIALPITVGSTPMFSFYTVDTGSTWMMEQDYHEFVGLHTVTFVDWDGTVLWTGPVEHGTSATAPKVPDREGYTHTGWDADFSNVTASMTVTAQYQINMYTVTFKINGEVVDTQTVDHGAGAVDPGGLPPSGIEHYKTVWDTDFSIVKSDLIITAVIIIETYTVQFINYNGTAPSIQFVRYGDDAVPPDNPFREGYIFTGWDKSYTEISADTVIGATYKVDIKIVAIQVSDVEIKNGELQALRYTVLPDNATNKSVSFSSADETVVGVDEGGVLQANSVGSTTITITALDGNGVTATCVVNVTADTEITSLWLIPNDFYLQIGKTTVVAADIIAGDDADTALLWTSSDTGIATVDKFGRVKGIAAGAAIITARLKSDASVFATSRVEAIEEEEYIRELYADDSIHKELIIHSVDGRFADITNSDIVAESMVIKEAVSTSEPVLLGGCINNSFEILVNAKRFLRNPPSGEIQVYQLIKGTRIDLFNGVIDTAKRQGDKITRKLIAYDKMYSKGDVNVAAWFLNLRFPITVKFLREALFKKIGIPVQSVSLPCDDFKIYQNYEYYTDESSSSDEKKKRILYDVPDKLKASEIIRDICEVNGTFGWMNRVGAFEFVFLKNSETKEIHPINIFDSEGNCPVNAVEIYLDDKEVDPSITAASSYNDKQKYSIDDGNFIVSATRGATLDAKSYNSYQMTYKRLILDALHEKKWVSCECRQKFDPTIKIGSDIYFRNQKYLSDGTQYVWETNSAALERTINGIQSVTETIMANIGYYSASGNKKKVTKQVKNNSKAISNLKSSIGSIGSDYYNGTGGGSGGGTQPGGGLKAVSVKSLPSNPDSNTIYLIQGEVMVY